MDATLTLLMGGKKQKSVVFIGDGAAWIWNLVDEYFPNAVEIVDYMHAKSHLYEVAKLAFGETEIEVIGAWIKETEPLLYEGNITAVVARIRALATQQSEVSDSLQKEARYFEKHADRMRYKKFREKGINPVLALRCLVKNGAWDKYWNELPQAA